LSDGVKAYNMEKIFPLPCWLTEGMQLDLNLWAWPEVSYVTTNPMTCEQHALLRDDLKCQGADELGETLKLWIDDGWSIESEDYYAVAAAIAAG